MIQVKRELYIETPREGYAVLLAVQGGPGLRRRETLACECAGRDDLPMDPRERFSIDNGRSWSDYTPLPEIVLFVEGATLFWGPNLPFYDPVTGLTLAVWLRQTIIPEPLRYHCHAYVRTSEDFGSTWGEPTMLRYQDGPYLDPDNPIDPTFLTRNNAYQGNNIIRHRNGTLIHAATSVNIPDDAPPTDPEGKYGNWWCPSDSRDIGSACFIGKWDAASRNYNWVCGERVYLPMSVSSRGLCEAEVAELHDGRVLLIWRGCDSPETPGRKWFSVSTDGGMTLSAVAELKYDDGTRFYSPSSYHRLIRHGVTGKLFWIGNICPEPPDGDHPRHPLIIAEVDETIPAIKRDTVTIVDTRQPGEGKLLALSNFSILENPETHEFELYMPRYSAHADDDSDLKKIYHANAYKYTITV